MNVLGESVDGEPVPEQIAVADQWRLLGRILKRRRPRMFRRVLELLELEAAEISDTESYR